MSSELTFKADDSVSQLVAATTILIDESIYVFTNLDTEEISDKELNKLAKSLLNNIDRTQSMIEAIALIPSEAIIECKLKLQQAIDKLYTCLTNTHRLYQQQLLSGELDTSGAINYADFCYSLGIKLLERATQIEPEQEEEVQLIYEDDEQWL